MQRLQQAVRFIYGLLWTVFGLNYFFHFLQNPTMSEAGQAFSGAIYDTGYLFPLIKIIEISCGIMLLSGLYIPLALILLAPILVGIVSLHIFLNPAGIPMSVILVIMHLALMIRNKEAYSGILKAK